MSTQRIDARRCLAALAGVFLVLALWVVASHAEPVIVYTRPDGGLSVVSPSPALVMEFHRFGRPTGTLSWTGPPVADPTGGVMSLAQAEAAALAFVRGLVPADATDVAVVDRAVLPASRKFRNAWVRAGPGVGVDMPRARAIHATQVRAEARKRLVKSAEDQALAEDAGDAARAAAHRAYQGQVRALLRSLDADLAALATPEALVAWPPVWPADPGGP